MQTVRRIALFTGLSLALLTMPLTGCEKKPEAPAKSAPDAPAATKHDDHDHDHDHADDTHGAHDHGPTTQLGEQTAEGFTIKAARSGEIKPGEHAAIDTWITGGTAKVSTVRVWVGSQDAKGSMKAKADLLKDKWHADAEVPNPVPAGGKLWVEIETDKAQKVVVGFDLKP
jgi:ABC-type Zn2+ transport system substrate-binding protein/surface adhesin